MRIMIPPLRRHTHARSISLGLIAVFLIWSGCADNTLLTDTAQNEAIQRSIDDPAIAKAAAAQGRLADDLLDRDGIEGLGTRLNSDGQPEIVVYARSAKAAAAANIPAHVDRIPTSVLVTGLIMARSDETSRARPAPIGFSVGHPDITAGTIGARVRDNSGKIFLLSNNHVLANSNDASEGDNILQPGPADGGTASDAIGTLADFVVISFSGNNTMDAAIAAVNAIDLDGVTPADEGYGAPGTSPVDPTLGMPVQKYGRTTGHTQGQVAEINVTVNVCYVCANPVCTRCAQSARFVDQIGISDGSFSSGGDSGSLIVTNDGENDPVGLLFAGGGDRTFANPIQPVLTAFGVTIDPTKNGGPDPNSPPAASFSFSCTDLSCSFDGSASTDTDGTITAFHWDFGDESTGSGAMTNHTYQGEGTYSVTLTVTDDDGDTDSEIQSVNVSSGASGGDNITLSTSGYKVRGLQKADLNWSGASSTLVDVERDGATIETVANKGNFTDDIDRRGGGSYTYRICEAGTSTCSNESTVTF